MTRIKSDFGSLYWTSPNDQLYVLRRNGTNLISKGLKAQDISIFGPHMQPSPPKACLRPKQNSGIVVSLKEKTSTSLTLLMPSHMIEHCGETSTATMEYIIYYKAHDELSWMFTATFEGEFTLMGLKPFTNYEISVAVSNYYTDEMDVVKGPIIALQTGIGAPSEPQNVTASVLNPIMVRVTWSPPLQLNGLTVHYEIYWKTERTLSGVRQKEQPVVEEQLAQNSTQYLTTLLNKLSPNETYTIWVKAYSETNETSSDSEKVQVNTFPEPSDFVLVNKTPYHLLITWEVSPYVDDYIVQFSPITSTQWIDVQVDNDTQDAVTILKENLQPKTQYRFRLVLFYKDYPEEYVWPQDSRFIYETLGDKPTPPGIPKIQYVKPDIYKLWWEASRDNGAPIELYRLEGLELPYHRNKRNSNRPAFFYTAPSVEEEEREWQQFYNGTDTSWIIDGLSEKYKYEFRVSALNAYGWSDPSESITFDLNEAARMAEKQSPMTLIAIATFVPFSVFLVVILCIVCRKYGKPKKVQVVSIPRGPDVELATLRELPRRGVHNTNVLYVSTQPNSEELTLLPHIRRDQITLTKFLGSGAFGEVFEGKARGIFSSSGEMKVAVKTLRKGASDQEKSEFLQEAQLMSNFKHEHILQLLGVCLDNDPHFIIMELMQGGDLLTYLRSSRNPNVDTPSLTLIELLKMCLDVAKGCRYLEEMHFVHRDLACRNCLVSSKESESRIVKIGDFGLARDIYKNDYYRKEGEGLLPVRWMAPESLVDGVFTSQSDVWAFGVLLWEIMTLGQQPYPARNNLEVLHYVRRGGRLGKPTDCPETLHNLMLKCWEFVADKRPTFKYCLDVLENLHLQKLRNPTTGAHEGQYISTVQECDEEETNRERSPFLPEPPPTFPKYLELLYEPETLIPNDGYEVPNQMLKEKSSSTAPQNKDVQINNN